MFAKLSAFLQESRQELNRVNWPTRQETVKLTLVVIGLSIGLSFFLGALDFAFTSLLKTVLDFKINASL